MNLIYIDKDLEFTDNFIVFDDDNNIVTGLTTFTKKLYNPNGIEVANISGGIPVTISELQDGLYSVSFTPDIYGNWELIVSEPTYFPDGKIGHYNVSAGNKVILENLKRILGLCHENFRIYNQAGDLVEGIIKIYDNATDLENDQNPVAEYEIKTNYGAGKEKRLVTEYISKRIA